MTHAIDGYIDRFWALVATLRAHPRVLVLGAWAGAGLGERSLDALERSLGRPMGPALRALYAQADGLQLRWIDRAAPHFDPEKHTPRHEPAPWTYGLQGYPPETGIAMILPAAMALQDRWRGVVMADRSRDDEPFDVAGRSYPGERSFLERLRVFDLFGFEHDAALVLDGPEPPLVFSSDHRATYLDSVATDVGSYLEFLLARKAVYDERRFYDYWWRQRRGLPEVPASLSTPRAWWTPERVLDLDRYFQAVDLHRATPPIHTPPAASAAISLDAPLETILTGGGALTLRGQPRAARLPAWVAVELVWPAVESALQDLDVSRPVWRGAAPPEAPALRSAAERLRDQLVADDPGAAAAALRALLSRVAAASPTLRHLTAWKILARWADAGVGSVGAALAATLRAAGEDARDPRLLARLEEAISLDLDAYAPLTPDRQAP